MPSFFLAECCQRFKLDGPLSLKFSGETRMVEPIALLPLAKEALKPTSSVVDALLAPKLAQLKRWALDKNLRSRVKGALLEDVSEKYLRRLLRRVSGITSLVFQQQAVPLPQVYEPLLLEDVSKRTAYRIDRRRPASKPVHWMSLTRPGTRSFIVDGAGMGKSTFAKHLCMLELAESDRIPIFIELRRIGAGEALLEVLARDFDDLHRIFDRELFLQLLSVGRFLVILDGLDEVAGDLRSSICSQIEDLAVKADSASIIVTSRPEVPLPAMAEGKTYQFLPLNKSQAISLIEKFDAFASVDVGARLISRIDELPQHFLEKPILVALLYRSFGYNGEISPNESSFYDDLYSALFKGHDLSKGGFARIKISGLEFDGFRRLTRGFAFLLIVDPPLGMLGEASALEYVERAVALSGVRPTSNGNFLDDLLLAVPLLMRDGGELRFSHKTIGEYFAADFLSSFPRGGDLIKSIINSNRDQQFAQVILFLKTMNPQLFRREVVAPSLERFLGLSAVIDDEVIRSAKFVIGKYRMMVGGDYSIEDVGSSNMVMAGFNEAKVHVNVALDLGGDVSFLDLFIDQISDELVGKSPELSFDAFADMPRKKWFGMDELIAMGGKELEKFRAIIPTLCSFACEVHNRHAQNLLPFVISEEKVLQLLAEIRDENYASDMLQALIASK